MRRVLLSIGYWENYSLKEIDDYFFDIFCTLEIGKINKLIEFVLEKEHKYWFSLIPQACEYEDGEPFDAEVDEAIGFLLDSIDGEDTIETNLLIKEVILTGLVSARKYLLEQK